MRISDTVWFKHKFITQPTITPADMIVKVLTNLTQALKGKTNWDGLEQIESLKRLKKLLTNTPPPPPVNTTPTPTHTAEPRVENPKQTTLDTTEPKVETPTVTFDTETKPPNNTAYTLPKLHQSEPRVQKEQSKGIISKATIDKPMPPNKNQLAKIQRARIPRCYNFDAQTHKRLNQEYAQLIHDADTGEYLNY